MKRKTIGIISALFVVGLVPAAAAASTDCKGWNTEEFFKKVTVADVARCLEADADPNARGEHGLTPLHWAAADNETPAVIQILLAAGAGRAGGCAAAVADVQGGRRDELRAGPALVVLVLG